MEFRLQVAVRPGPAAAFGFSLPDRLLTLQAPELVQATPPLAAFPVASARTEALVYRLG